MDPTDTKRNYPFDRGQQPITMDIDINGNGDRFPQ